MAAARDQCRPTFYEMALDAITVELDLVEPRRAARHVLAQRCELRLHKTGKGRRPGTWQHSRAEARCRSMRGFALGHDRMGS